MNQPCPASLQDFSVPQCFLDDLSCPFKQKDSTVLGTYVFPAVMRVGNNQIPVFWARLNRSRGGKPSGSQSKRGFVVLLLPPLGVCLFTRLGAGSSGTEAAPALKEALPENVP